MVSIIMPAYNSEKYISEAINSILRQTYRNWELLVIDDCSTDKTLMVINSFNDNRIKVHTTSINSGAAFARNIGIEKAQGEFIAFLDSDDVWKPEKLERQIKFMEDNKYPFTYTNYTLVNDGDEEIKKQVSPLKLNYINIMKQNNIGCSTAIYNANTIGKVYMPLEAIKREDFATWLAILRKISFAYNVNEDLSFYRTGNLSSVSASKFKMIKWQWNVYRHVEKINFFSAFYYLVNWAIRGMIKHKKTD